MTKMSSVSQAALTGIAVASLDLLGALVTGDVTQERPQVAMSAGS